MSTKKSSEKKATKKKSSEKKSSEKKVTIEVTQTDIKRGRKGEPRSCMVARAINRQLKRSKVHASVGGAEVTIRTNGSGLFSPASYFTAKLPKHVTKKIAAFDSKSKKSNKPFKFTVRLPADVIKASK